MALNGLGKPGLKTSSDQVSKTFLKSWRQLEDKDTDEDKHTEEIEGPESL